MLEQLEDFEETLHLYFETNDIEYDKDTLELYSKSNQQFNSNIICLAEGAESLEDFLEDYKGQSLNYYDLVLSKVIEYFRENKIKDLMEYGNDADEGLYHFSSMYQEIMDKLDIKYSNVYTKDISDGKYLTIIIFEDNSSIKIDTSAWNDRKVVAENVESICKKYEEIKEKMLQNVVKNETEIEYGFN